MEEKGTISIHTENIFPIIKKFLYSDHEIFLRELVSNAVDATQKLKKLASMGEYNGDLGDIKIKVSVDEKLRQITVSDRGLGMTAEEIKKYINQIAFSGAAEFVEKFKDKGDAKDIIGKFGLGFYSAFMVSEKVEIQTLSYQEGAVPARWLCDGSTEFEISKTVKKDRGTDIILHINEDSKEFLDKFRLKQILEKYGKFLPVEIEFDGKVINNTLPLWTKNPADLKDEDYLKFYKELYPFSEDPLFWIHLNVDYPFNLTGILYFPKLKKDFEFQRNKIQLYSRQVFITDEVKDVVPEFLMLLHGVLDSPDIPLNVSRSFLQSDSNVKKINSHITKKVADKLSDLFKSDRKAFEEKFEDIGLFVKYGMITDDKFYERAKDFCLLKNTSGAVFTLAEYQDKISGSQKDKNETLVMLYTSDKVGQDSFVKVALKRGYDVLVFDDPIDAHFIGLLERNLEKVSLRRVDSDSMDKLVEKDTKIDSVLSEDETKKIRELFEGIINNKDWKVEVESLSPEELPISILLPEFMRRMKEMSANGGGGMSFMGTMPDSYQVVVNGNHSLIRKLLDTKKAESRKALARQVFQLGKLGQGMLKGEELTDFIEKQVDLLGA